jgi:hypothetical protein
MVEQDDWWRSATTYVPVNAPSIGQVSLTFFRITMRTFIKRDEININGKTLGRFSWFLFFSYPQGNHFHMGCDFPGHPCVIN